METKKKDNANLENKRAYFLQIGFIVSIAAALLFVEWTTDEVANNYRENLVGVEIEIEQLPIIRQTEAKPPEPKTVEKLNIQADNIDIKEELDAQQLDADYDKKTIVEPLSLNDEDIEVISTPFWFAEEMPEFPGGKEKMLKFIAESIKYPAQAIENEIQGRVYVRFLVTEKGTIEQIDLVRSLHPLLDEEALRVIKLFPNWIAGKQAGKAVKVWCTIPVTFILY